MVQLESVQRKHYDGLTNGHTTKRSPLGRVRNQLLDIIDLLRKGRLPESSWPGSWAAGTQPPVERECAEQGKREELSKFQKHLM